VKTEELEQLQSRIQTQKIVFEDYAERKLSLQEEIDRKKKELEER
jgi:hypothetical protein